jgi:hypothetical protein
VITQCNVSSNSMQQGWATYERTRVQEFVVTGREAEERHLLTTDKTKPSLTNTSNRRHLNITRRLTFVIFQIRIRKLKSDLYL